MISCVKKKTALECVRSGACRTGRNALATPPSQRASNPRTETVSRRPRSPNRRKTKHQLTTKLTFYTKLRTGIKSFCIETDSSDRFWAFFVALWSLLGRCCLSVVRGGLKPPSLAPFPRLFSFSRLDSPCCCCKSEDFAATRWRGATRRYLPVIVAVNPRRRS